MKNLLAIVCFVATFVSMVSCTSKPQPWEYKVVKVAGKEGADLPNFGSLAYGDQTAMLNKMGSEGWELVSTYTEVETAFPNFGSAEYVTGLRDNTRTCVVNFVFKRQSNGDNASKNKTKKK